MAADEQDYSLAPPARAVTAGPSFHWFGYYDKFPWNESQKLLLANENDFMDRILQTGDTINVGFVDLEAGTELGRAVRRGGPRRAVR